ncbi:MAG: hypothetical protein J0H31_06740 [Alphaproteobacteria bacterium]|nr:hypothetical protein [Alphaproteobacteria bacterium]
MRIWTGLSVFGLALVVGILFLRPDLRGWTPAKWTDPAIKVEPIHQEDVPFTVGDCLRGSIDTHGAPSTRDYAGTATVTVFTCRSQSSAMKIMIVYLLAALSYPSYRLIRHRRRR